MTDQDTTEHVAAKPAGDQDGYTVLARRYRPKQFDECIGQEHVARSLKNAIINNRVAHAYLFTGSRGVGKTSTARILAKALNCENGPTGTPCDKCDICLSIASGEDVDVIEIDGASNRGIDEVRDLRQAVNYRPSRSRFKIYIIDEVHMLTMQAFNALLKTLEEPPEHAKFIFATTEPQKIPITILSRCQRFDFSGIDQPKIVQRLREIVEAEGMKADDEALEVVARRAAGSMRDSQSLLDQLLAFGGECLTAEDVHRIMGTAGEQRVADLVAALLAKDAAAALLMVEESVTQGVQLGEWVEQMLQYFRDLMVLRVNPQATLVSMPNRRREELLRQSEGLTPERVLEMMDLLSACRSRMKASTYGRTLLEMTLVRLCRLDRFLSLESMLANPPALPAVSSGASSSPTAIPRGLDRPPSLVPRQPVDSKKKSRIADSPSAGDVSPQPPLSGSPLSPPRDTVAPIQEMLTSPPVVAPEQPPPTSQPTLELTPESVEPFFRTLCGNLDDFVLVTMLKTADRIEFRPPATLVVHFPPDRGNSKKHCEEPARIGKVETLCRELAGRQVNLRFELGLAPEGVAAAPKKRESYGRLMELAHKDPIVKKAEEILDAKLIGVDQAPPRPVANTIIPELEKEE